LDKGELRGIGSLAEIAPEQPEGLELELELCGPEQEIRQAMGDRSISQSQRLAADQFRVALRLPGQREVDACVDDLRRRQVSIVSMSRRRITLEDAFLEILAQPAEPS
jgi:ABC-2 type transport system ATP-binding protein